MATTSNRIDDIADKLHAACSDAVADKTRQSNEARAEINGLSDDMNGVSGTRLGTAVAIAAMAHAENWTNAEIAQAIGNVKKRASNYDSSVNKTVGVFVSEMKQFASPEVRASFPTTLAALQAAWLAEQDYIASLEGDEKKNADTPIRKFKPRIYHLVIECARRIKDGKLVAPVCAEDVVQWARENDPSFDEERVAKAIAAGIAKLEEHLGNFGLAGVPDVKLATDFLKTLKAKDLLAARARMLAEAGDTGEPVLDDGSVAGEQPQVAGGPVLIEGAFDYQADALDKLDQIAA
jgi:hypothetical protein